MIIKVEGPVKITRVFDIYLRSCEIKRIANDLRVNLLLSLLYLKKSNLVLIEKYSDQDNILRSVVRLKGTPKVILRKRGDRSLEEIPLDELFAISQLVAEHNKISLGSDEHLRAILEVLELKRLTSNAETILKKVIKGQS